MEKADGLWKISHKPPAYRKDTFRHEDVTVQVTYPTRIRSVLRLSTPMHLAILMLMKLIGREYITRVCVPAE